MTEKRKRRAAPSRTYPAEFEQRQDELLRDRARAAEYLMHALNHGDEIDFRLVLADVVRARSVTRVAAAAGIHRTTLHRMLNPADKPSSSSMVKVLGACDLDLLGEKRNGA